MREIPGIVLHWPAYHRKDLDHLKGEALVSHIDADHKKRKYRMIGYHYVVNQDTDDAWKVYEGRPDAALGAHSYGPGNTRLGISCAYAMDDKDLDPAMLETLAQLISDLAATYGFTLNRSNVTGHRDWLPTECPGSLLYSKIDWLIKRAQELRPAAKRKRGGDSVYPDQQVSEIDIYVDGKKQKGMLINSQAHIHVSLLSALGVSVRYDAKDHRVYLDKEEKKKEPKKPSKQAGGDD